MVANVVRPAIKRAQEQEIEDKAKVANVQRHQARRKAARAKLVKKHGNAGLTEKQMEGTINNELWREDLANTPTSDFYHGNRPDPADNALNYGLAAAIMAPTAGTATIGNTILGIGKALSPSTYITPTAQLFGVSPELAASLGMGADNALIYGFGAHGAADAMENGLRWQNALEMAPIAAKGFSAARSFVISGLNTVTRNAPRLIPRVGFQQGGLRIGNSVYRAPKG